MLQIDMEMPKCCTECPLWSNYYSYCKILKTFFMEDGKEFEPDEVREDGCPLKEG